MDELVELGLMIIIHLLALILAVHILLLLLLLLLGVHMLLVIHIDDVTLRWLVIVVFVVYGLSSPPRHPLSLITINTKRSNINITRMIMDLL